MAQEQSTYLDTPAKIIKAIYDLLRSDAGSMAGLNIRHRLLRQGAESIAQSIRFPESKPDFGGLAQRVQSILDRSKSHDRASDSAYFKTELCLLRDELASAGVSRRCEAESFTTVTHKITSDIIGLKFAADDEAPGGGHYPTDALEPIRVGRVFGWPYELTAAFKYMARMGKKAGESPVEAIRKAAHLLGRYADHLEGKE